jgi:DNA-directed RNA polymerase subunit RPC12/RpoP
MHQAENKEIWYKCEFCGRRFKSARERSGSKLCRNCIELRRLIRTWVKNGVWVKEAEELGR